MIKFIGFILITIFAGLKANAQNIPQYRDWNGSSYGAATAFPATGIASDFGPRFKNSDNWLCFDCAFHFGQ